MTAIRTKLGARDQAFNTIFAPTGNIPETNVQRAIEHVMGYVLGLPTLPGSSVDNTVPRFVGTTGSLEGTAVTISDANFLGTVAGVGIGGATADVTNRLSVNTPAVLFNRETANIQVKLNKNAAGDTASFLFQTGFSGRAEIGTIGDDDFQFKVSPDGSAFFSGIIIDKDDGTVNIPLGLTIPVSAAPVVNANGEIALDTTVADFSHGLLRFFGGEEQFIISVPVAALTGPVGGRVLSYNATNDEFELVAPASSGANTALSNLASVAINTTLLPGANDGAALGSGTLAFSDLFLAEGGIINWDNGDVTITQTGNTLAFAGATTAYTFDATLQTTSSAAAFLGAHLISTDAGVDAGPYMLLDRNSASPAVNDFIGAVLFRGRDSAANSQDYALISTRILDTTNASEDAEIVFFAQSGGTMTDALSVQPGLTTIKGVLGGNCTLAMTGAGNGCIEFGRVDGVASTPFLDFHAGATAVDFDARIIALTGTGASGGGRLDIISADLRGGANGATSSIRLAGKETIWVPATAMWKATAAAGPSTGQLGVGAIAQNYLAYDPTGIEDAYFSIAMPKSWNVGQISAQFYWIHPATTTNFGVSWTCFALSYDDGETIVGTGHGGATATDTGGTTSAMYISPETAAFTIGNTPQDNAWVTFIARRDPTAGADTLAVDAYLFGVKIFYTTDAANDT